MILNDILINFTWKDVIDTEHLLKIFKASENNKEQLYAYKVSSIIEFLDS